MPPKQVKKKKGISLTPEKKKLLKQLIMQKAAEELKKQQEKEAEEKRAAVSARVPKLEIDGLDESGLQKKVQELYVTVVRLEEEKYDWEGRLGRQTEEINELNIKVNDIKGKFSKPMLKKVAKKSTKLTSKSKLTSFANLKSTGQSKFALEPDKDEEKPDWGADSLKQHKAEDVAPAEEEAEEEEEEEE
jgi:troponin I, cardiac muscle